MPLATLADIEAPRGAGYVEELLAVADDPTAGDNTAARQARLDWALQEGDTVITRYLPVDALVTGSGVLLQFAIDEALYALERTRDGGPTEQQAIEAERRRADMAAMRENEQFPGNPENHRTFSPTTVESASPFNSHRLLGFT